MSHLALAQASVIADLVRGAPDAPSSSQGVRSSGDVHPSVSGLHPAAPSAVPVAAAASRLATVDYSALMLDSWLSEYARERSSFDSVSLFCDIKLRELLELTHSLHQRSDEPMQTVAGSERAAPPPSKVRTAVCIDLFDILIGSIIHGGGGGGGTKDDLAAAPASSSRQALGMLLLRLRDELVRSIYVQPVPAHLFLQYSPWFHQPQQQQRHLGGHPHQQRRRAGQQPLGSLTSRGTRPRAEEKEHSLSGSSTHRARLTSSSHVPSAPSGPPSCLSGLMDCTEWFSLLPGAVARNAALATQARLVMIPSKLFRLRQIQKRVVGGMTHAWRSRLLRWKFTEWRAVTQQRKEDRSLDRASILANRLTDRMNVLEARVTLFSWRAVVVKRKYEAVKLLRSRGLASHTNLLAETTRLTEETRDLREEAHRLETNNASLAVELKTLRAQLEHSQVDLQDSAKHAHQCAELLDALRAPLHIVFQAVGAQIDSFSSREFKSFHPLLGVVVDAEFQSLLDPLGLPITHSSQIQSLQGGSELSALCAAQHQSPTPKLRLQLSAQIVARWLALQLRLGSQVLSGGQGSFSEYLVKQENQQRLAAALARVRQLCSSSPPSILPPFPLPVRRKPVPPAGAASTQGAPGVTSPPPPATAMLGGGLLPGRARRGPLPAPVIPPPATAAGEEKEEGDEASAEGTLSPSRPGGAGARVRNRVGGVVGSPGGTKKGTGKSDDPSAETLAKLRRQAEARSQAIPAGTLSTPLRVFASLRDTDRPESVFAVSSLLMHADDDIAHSLRLPADKRWATQEREQVTALRGLMDSLRVTPAMRPAEMDIAVGTVNDGLTAASTALLRARAAQQRLHAVEDDVFAQSVKLLHQQSQRKHRHGEKENNMPTDLLDLDMSLYTDVLDPSAQNPSRTDIAETNRLLEEYCRDLHKIFLFYSATSTSAQLAGALGATSLLASATQTEPRMANAEFWRFVRDCKLKLQQTALIDQVYTIVTRRASAAAHDATADFASVSGSVTRRGSTSSTAGSVSGSGVGAASALSLTEEESRAEALRIASGIDVGLSFRGFGETLVRLALIKFQGEKLLARKVRNMLLGHVLPNTSAKAVAFQKAQQQAAAAAATLAAQGGGSSSSSSSAPSAGAGSPGASLSSLEVEAVFRKHQTLLKAIFHIYARITPQFMTMTFNDFLGFAREFELLHKYVTQHDLKQLFQHCLLSAPGETSSAAAGGTASASAAGGVASPNATAGGVASPGGIDSGSMPGGVKRQTTLLGGGGGGGADDEDDASGVPQPAKELSYRQFLELLAAVSHFVLRNPYFSASERVDKFIVGVLASRKKLPAKVYRSAV